MDPHPPDEYGEAVAAVYDDLYPDTTHPPDEVVATLVDLAGDGPVLELGIGTGRVALPLAAAGVDVRGIDASPAMVERLRAKEGGDAIPVTIADFGDADLGTGHALVFIAFNTFFALQSQERQVACFAAAASALRSGGRFVVAGFFPDIARFDRGQRVSAVEVNPDRVVLNVGLHHPLEQQIEGTILVIAEGRTDSYPVALRYAWPAELDLMGRLAGLELEHRWGGWDRSPFTEASGGHVSVWRRP